MGLSQPLVDLALSLPGLDGAADALASIVSRAYDALGGARQPVKDALNGTWLGHPFHPPSTDVPVGAWTVTALLDLIGDRDGARGALGVGLAATVPTIASGLTEWLDTYGRPRRLGVVHAGLNVLATSLCAASYVVRPRAYGTGVALFLAGYGIVSLSALYGGVLALDLQIGANRAHFAEPASDEVDAGAFDDIPDGGMRRVDAGGYPVLLVRDGGEVFALGAVCAHQSGPLEQGTLDLAGGTVTCPWHGSRFCLRDGTVERGPSAYPQPVFRARVADGRVRVTPADPSGLRPTLRRGLRTRSRC